MDLRRSTERLFFCLLSLVLALGTSHAQAPALTTINDTVYRADGTPAAGQLVITWPAFTTADNKPVAAGEKTLTLGVNGALNTQLAPNEGATPAGSYYKVVYKLSDGTTATEYWTVPAMTPTNIGAIRATVVPAQVAAQLVTRQYVDTVLTGPSTDLVHKSTAETITGLKSFTTSPSVPDPAVSGDAANKHYVDTQISPINGPDGMRIGNIRQAHLFSGSDAGAKINACIANLPTTGGTCDARGFEGPQSITTSIVVDRPTTLLLGCAVFTLTGSGEFAVTSSLRAMGCVQTTNNLTTGTILRSQKAGCIFRFPTGASSKVEQFELADFQVQGGGGSYDNCVVDVPNNVGGSFDGNQARWYFHDLWIANMGNSASTRAALNFGQSIYWVSVERNIMSNNLGGDISTGYADDLNITHNFFWQLSAYQPHIRFVGGTLSHITENEFENGTGSTQPDILLLTESNSQRGFVNISNNKFGSELEGGRSYKIRAYSPSFTSALISSVWFQGNYVSGLSSTSPITYAIQLDNPTSNWIVADNEFVSVSTIINDNASAVTTGAGHNVFKRNLIMPPTTGTKCFTNGGRGFWEADQTIGCSDRGFGNALKQTETPELRNRLTYSEDLSNAAWTKSTSVSVTTGQTDPFGTGRAVLLTNNGSAAFSNAHAVINTTALGNRVFVKFWAKAGTLDRLDVGVFDTNIGTVPADGIAQLKLSSSWQEYKLSFSLLNAAHAHDLYLYVGESSTTNNGNLSLFGVQVSDYDSDYVPTAGAAFGDTTVGSRHERKVEFAKDIFVAGSSANPTTNKFQITGASTGGTRTVTLADGNSVTVVPDSGAVNNFMTGITAAGAITKAQPAFANLSGTAGVSQGGTGQTTFTKGDLLAAANSTTLNKLPIGTDGQVLTADSTQTNGMKWASASTLLDYQKAGSAIVGDGTDKTLFTYTLPGGTLAAGKGLRIMTELQHTVGTGNITYKIFFGSTQVLSQGSTSTVMAKLGAVVFNDPGSTMSQQGTATDLLFGSSIAALPTAPAVGAENTANPVVIKVTFNAASSEQVTPKVWLVEAIR